MKLTKISIKNFRSIEALEFNLSDFTSLVGQNNCGKSTIIQAIKIFLKGEKPELHDWPKDAPEGTEIEMVGTFEDIQPWERATPGIAGLIDGDKICLKFNSSIQDGKVKCTPEAFKRVATTVGMSDKWSELSAELKAAATGLGLTSTSFKTKDSKQKLLKHVEDNLPHLITWTDPQWTSENISIPNALQQGLPLPVLVPAVRDASDEGSNAAKSSFGMLIQQLVLPAVEVTDEFKELIEAVKQLNKRLSGDGMDQLAAVADIETQLTSRLSSLIQASAKIRLSPPDTNKFIGTSTSIKLNDGRAETDISFQGHGLQRTLILALLEMIATREAMNDGDEPTQRSIVLLFEEPELYLHPQLMRRLKGVLLEIAKSQHWQVVITTHSPVLIDVVDNPKSLVIINRESPEKAPYKVQLETDPFEGEDHEERQRLRASLDFHPSVNEAFFAKQVVLVEGDTEMTMLRHRSQPHLRYGISQEQYDTTTIVSCGGKWTIVPIARLLSHFRIPYRVIHDTDRKGKTDEELSRAKAIHPFKANKKISDVVGQDEKIMRVEDTVEHILWKEEDAPNSDKPYEAWLKINEMMSNGTDAGIEHPDKLKALYDFSYNWAASEANQVEEVQENTESAPA